MKITREDRTTFLVKQFNFPDGQPHVALEPCEGHVRITVRIANGNDLLSVLLAEETLRHAGATNISLHITYMLGARMDRRIGPGQPFSLDVVARLLRDRFECFTILDPHSQRACDLLRAEGILPIDMVRRTLDRLGWSSSRDDVALCAPDKGATWRVLTYAEALGSYYYKERGCIPVVQCLKERDLSTGALSSFRLAEGQKVPRRVLICDDICDGGGTFTPVAKLLREAGAEEVSLFVTHAILSKFKIPDLVDHVFTTDSYMDEAYYRSLHPKTVTCFPLDDSSWRL